MGCIQLTRINLIQQCYHRNRLVGAPVETEQVKNGPTKIIETPQTRFSGLEERVMTFEEQVHLHYQRIANKNAIWAMESWNMVLDEGIARAQEFWKTIDNMTQADKVDKSIVRARKFWEMIEKTDKADEAGSPNPDGRDCNGDGKKEAAEDIELDEVHAEETKKIDGEATTESAVCNVRTRQQGQKPMRCGRKSHVAVTELRR